MQFLQFSGRKGADTQEIANIIKSYLFTNSE